MLDIWIKSSIIVSQRENAEMKAFTKRLDECKEILTEKGLKVVDWCNFRFLVKNIYGRRNWIPDYLILLDMIPEYVFEEGKIKDRR